MSTEITEKSITTADSNQQPLKTIREGALAASIWNRKSAVGNEYLEFSLSRSWKSKDGDKEGYSQNFFETNEKALVHVVVKACHFIRAWQTELNVTAQNNALTGDELELA